MSPKQEWWVVPARRKWRWTNPRLKDGRWTILICNLLSSVSHELSSYSPEECRMAAIQWIDTLGVNYGSRGAL